MGIIMLRLNFETVEIEKINNLTINHVHPFVRKKSLVLLLKSHGIAHNLISKIVNISENTVRNYLNGYLDVGTASLTEIPFNKPESELVQFESVIINYFETTPPSTIKQACAELKEKHEIQIGETQLRKYIKSLGIKYRKTGSIPAKMDNKKQKDFHDNILQPKLDEAREGKREVYFVDAAHFVLGAFLAFLWSFKRIFVRTPSGRQRFNVLGALNAITKKMISIKNDSYITATEVCELLKKLKAQATLPITVILDNARYQKCKIVFELAKELDIELLYLPTYSPNLNLIERFWKFTKKTCLNSKYYENFALFKGQISNLVDNAHMTNSKELESLLTLNFQLYSDNQIIQAV
jgi:transposase